MNFVSLEYLVLLGVAFGVTFALSGRPVSWFLTGASILFYGWWDVAYIWLVVAVSLITWWGGIALEKKKSPRFLWLFIGADLAFLLYFKYYLFFLSNLGAALQTVGFDMSLTLPAIILPIGVSFYTFQAIAYLADVYQEEIKAERSFLDVLLFLTFFPQIVAGPIEHAKHLLPQIKRLETGYLPSRENIAEGLFMIAKGLVIKFVFADNLSVFVDDIFADVAGQTDLNVLLATYLFSLQIYGDFYGYTMIALGSASLFGVELINNFDHPYLKRNIQEFWRRWHISLSRWFMQYVYFPLGGNRVPLYRYVANLFLTMVLVGFWHGASWKFMLWGGMNGVFLGVHRLYRRFTGGGPLIPGPFGYLLSALLTFHVVTMAWIPFRAPDMDSASAIFIKALHGYAHLFDASQLTYYWTPFYGFIAASFVLFELIDARWDLARLYAKAPVAMQATFLFVSALSSYLGPFKNVEFIYFQF